jgi:transketolase
MRDVFYLSKCHTAPALYVALALFGFFPLPALERYGQWGSGFESHPDARLTRGIEASGGSLGQIPGMAVGRAMAIRRNGPDHSDRMVYVMVGDGECDEGSVWEAFMAAGHYRLDNLVFLIDSNKSQAKGFVSQEMSLAPMADKLAAFNIDVLETRNGHDAAELVELLTLVRQRRAGKPLAIILNTVKGKKIADVQFNPNWHTSAPRCAEQAGLWLEELWQQDGRRLGIPAEFPHRLTQAISIMPPLHGNPDEILERQA